MIRQLQWVYDQMKCGGVFTVHKDKENKLVGMGKIPYDANCDTKIMVHDKPHQRIVLHSIYHKPQTRSWFVAYIFDGNETPLNLHTLMP